MSRGIYPVLQMPLDEEENIDELTLTREIEWLLELGSMQSKIVGGWMERLCLLIMRID